MRHALLITAALALAGPGARANAAEWPNAAARAIVADVQEVVTPNGVEERFKARIGGIDQWITVRGKDRGNPILLYLHGGPGSPAMPISWTYQRAWEDYFTVVQWDQRGAGKTWRANDPAQVGPTLVIDRYVQDALELIALLRERYGKRKVILLGHSWGTVLGVKAALARPQWVHAYVGIGQIIDFRANERIGHALALADARREGNARAIAELEAIAPYPGDAPLTVGRIDLQRKWTIHYGGLAAYRHDADFYFAAARLSPDYDRGDVAAFNHGGALTIPRMLPQLMQVDLRDVRRMEVPVVLFQGRHDYTTPTEPSERWLAALDAPHKQAVWFEHSAHLAPVEEPGRVLVELVTKVRPLAVE